jgi:hypothetical protein
MKHWWNNDLEGKLKIFLGMCCFNHEIFSLGLELGDPR